MNQPTMKDVDFLKEVIARGARAGSGYFQYAHIAACMIRKDGRLSEALEQVVTKGPVWAGDLISKNAKGDLLSLGLAVPVMVKGEQGFTGATYIAGTIHKAVVAINTGKIGA